MSVVDAFTAFMWSLVAWFTLQGIVPSPLRGGFVNELSDDFYPNTAASSDLTCTVVLDSKVSVVVTAPPAGPGVARDLEFRWPDQGGHGQFTASAVVPSSFGGLICFNKGNRTHIAGLGHMTLGATPSFTPQASAVIVPAAVTALAAPAVSLGRIDRAELALSAAGDALLFGTANVLGAFKLPASTGADLRTAFLNEESIRMCAGTSLVSVSISTLIVALQNDATSAVPIEIQPALETIHAPKATFSSPGAAYALCPGVADRTLKLARHSQNVHLAVGGYTANGAFSSAAIYDLDAGEVRGYPVPKSARSIAGRRELRAATMMPLSPTAVTNDRVLTLVFDTFAEDGTPTGAYTTAISMPHDIAHYKSLETGLVLTVLILVTIAGTIVGVALCVRCCKPKYQRQQDRVLAQSKRRQQKHDASASKARRQQDRARAKQRARASRNGTSAVPSILDEDFGTESGFSTERRVATPALFPTDGSASELPGAVAAPPTVASLAHSRSTAALYDGTSSSSDGLSGGIVVEY